MAAQNNGELKGYQLTREIKNLARISVIVRKRPLSKSETRKGDGDIVDVIDRNTVVLHEPRVKVDNTRYTEHHEFKIDRAFDEFSTNEEIYDDCIKRLVKAVYFDNAKCSCFAYGQTGSGKTYTMLGPLPYGKCGKPGIFELAVRDLFVLLRSNSKAEKQSAYVSFYEIYCGKLYDLLQNRKMVAALESGKKEVIVKDLKVEKVESEDDLLAKMILGVELRKIGVNSINFESSRSHAILQIDLKGVEKQTLGGKLVFIDLAGSERGSDTLMMSRSTQQDGVGINRSLLALKECIRAMDMESRHIPFRDSELTKVLRDIFTGKSHSVMISNISPTLSCCDPTLNTLRYSSRVKQFRSGKNQDNKAETHTRSLSPVFFRGSVDEKELNSPTTCVQNNSTLLVSGKGRRKEEDSVRSEDTNGDISHRHSARNSNGINTTTNNARSSAYVADSQDNRLIHRRSTDGCVSSQQNSRNSAQKQTNSTSENVTNNVSFKRNSVDGLPTKPAVQGPFLPRNTVGGNAGGSHKTSSAQRTHSSKATHTTRSAHRTSSPSQHEGDDEERLKGLKAKHQEVESAFFRTGAKLNEDGIFIITPGTRTNDSVDFKQQKVKEIRDDEIMKNRGGEAFDIPSVNFKFRKSSMVEDNTDVVINASGAKNFHPFGFKSTIDGEKRQRSKSQNRRYIEARFARGYESPIQAIFKDVSAVSPSPIEGGTSLKNFVADSSEPSNPLDSMDLDNASSDLLDLLRFAQWQIKPHAMIEKLCGEEKALDKMPLSELSSYGQLCYKSRHSRLRKLLDWLQQTDETYRSTVDPNILSSSNISERISDELNQYIKERIEDECERTLKLRQLWIEAESFLKLHHLIFEEYQSKSADSVRVTEDGDENFSHFDANFSEDIDVCDM